MPSVFRKESRSVQRFVGLPGATKARLWPTIAAILERERAAHQEIGDQIVLGALDRALIKGIIAGQYGDVFESLGKSLGFDVPTVERPASETASLPIREVTPQVGTRKPLARAK